MSLPNALTVSRFAAACLGGALLVTLPLPIASLLALVVFAFAVVTDWLDGYLARRMGAVSPLGIFLDPLADKVAVYTYLVHLTAIGVYPSWMLMLLLARDLIHDSYRAFATSRGIAVPANLLSKCKTALQMLSIMLALLAVSPAPFATRGLQDVALACMLAALVCGIVGAAQSMRGMGRIFSPAT